MIRRTYVSGVMIALAGLALVVMMGFASYPRDGARFISAPLLTGQEPGALIVPVEGVRRAALTDTWGAARSQGRRHEGLDIMAAQATPVLAVADGRVAKLTTSARGGTAIYLVDEARAYSFYYAHLSGYAADLHEGEEVRQGQIIGYVGATGNATAPHLHFEIQRVAPGAPSPHGEAIDPYPFLRTGEAPPAP